MIKPVSRKTMSVTQRISKYVTVTLDTLAEDKCTLYTNLPLEGKAGSFNATWVLRITTEHQNFNLEAR